MHMVASAMSTCAWSTARRELTLQAKGHQLPRAAEGCRLLVNGRHWRHGWERVRPAHRRGSAGGEKRRNPPAECLSRHCSLTKSKTLRHYLKSYT